MKGLSGMSVMGSGDFTHYLTYISNRFKENSQRVEFDSPPRRKTIKDMEKQLTLALNLDNKFVGFIPEKRLKTCNKCGKRKALFEFGKDWRTTDGKANTCRECRRKYRQKILK